MKKMSAKESAKRDELKLEKAYSHFRNAVADFVEIPLDMIGSMALKDFKIGARAVLHKVRAWEIVEKTKKKQGKGVRK